MKKDLLTFSRVVELFNEAGFDIASIDASDVVIHSMLISAIKENDMADKIFDVIADSGDINKEQVISDFLVYVSNEFSKYESEIKKRKEHAVNLGIYIEDTPQDIARKMEESKDIYKSNAYLSYCAMLSKNNINFLLLTIYESMILIESILCDEVNKGSFEMLAFFESDNPVFAERIRNILKHSNFYSFALDIYNDVDKMYKAINSKKDKK